MIGSFKKIFAASEVLLAIESGDLDQIKRCSIHTVWGLRRRNKLPKDMSKKVEDMVDFLADEAQFKYED